MTNIIEQVADSKSPDFLDVVARMISQDFPTARRRPVLRVPGRRGK